MKCCSLGMRLVVLNSDTMFEKLKKFIEMKNKDDSAYAGKCSIFQLALWFKLFIDSYQAETSISVEKMTFWTAGYEWRKNMFVWCHSGDAMPNFNSWIKVNIQLQNGDAGNCMMAEVSNIASRLTSVNCAQKHNFVCEVILHIPWIIIIMKNMSHATQQFVDENEMKKCSSGKCFYSGSSEEVSIINTQTLHILFLLSI